MMDLQEAREALGDVRASMHEKFEIKDGDGNDVRTHDARLAQLDSALANAIMAVEHLHDEHARELDLAQRILNRETVHFGNEIRDPFNRELDHSRAVVAKGA